MIDRDNDEEGAAGAAAGPPASPWSLDSRGLTVAMILGIIGAKLPVGLTMTGAKFKAPLAQKLEQWASGQWVSD